MKGTDIVRVLLVGKSPQSFSLSRQLLERNGCKCHFAGSLQAAGDLLHLWPFDIVLSAHIVPSETMGRLVRMLSGSGMSLFSTLRVEEGSWWLPVLKFGKECYGPALCVGDFAQVLVDLRKQRRAS
jgi:CheY-like chemotaxis protein